MPGLGKRLSMPGDGKMFAMAGAGASLSLAGGEFLAVNGRLEPLLITVGDGTSVVIGGETFLVGDDGERLTVGVGAGTSSSSGAVGGEARMTGGGYTGTSVA